MRFDCFIAIDWSARNAPSPVKPHKDAIWLAEANASKERVTTRYFRTRLDCMDYLTAKLKRQVKKGERTFIGFDLNFGYPQGTAKALRLKKDLPWKNLWKLIHQLVKDDRKNRNNRFSVGAELNRRIKAPLGPFWGVPAGQSGILLGPKKDFNYPIQAKKVVLAEKRIVEQRNHKLQPGWKLAYTGSVGSQALMGIPYLYRLRFLETTLKDHGLVWPFESGFGEEPLSETNDLLLYAEIWPSLIERPNKDSIPDREQVKTYVKWLLARQKGGTLGQLFAQPAGLSPEEEIASIREEGWVLGL